jgi:WD40 repeat protein/serine/threonine protein kinase
MDPPRHCAQCGAILSVYALEGVCGSCLLKPGFEPALESFGKPRDEADFPSQTENGTRFGDYELLEEIARGGMGIVYRARQVSLDRIVAVKMLLAGPLAGKDFVQRFRTEAAAAASLQHANIVAIHEVGYAEGQHFFAMDYVEGLTLAQLIAKGSLPARKAATYLKTIAEAIHFAHERNVLHRDLKPSNVLIDSATDQPRVTDFGLAKRLDAETELTLTGQMLGSPNFMPPEQATAKRGTVGKRSDVYSLGALLYYALTGRPPFQGETLTDVLLQVMNGDPLAPRLLTPSIPQDLETICLKCLEKEPDGRYQTAQELADELSRFLRDEPIRARPLSAFEKGCRWGRHNRVLALLMICLIVVFTGGFTATLWQWRKAVHNGKTELEQRQVAEEQRRLAQNNGERFEQNSYVSDMRLAQYAWDEGDLGRTLSLLEAHRPRTGETNRRGFEWYYFRKLCEGDPHITLRGHSNFLNAVRFSPDANALATRGGDNDLKLWDLTTQMQRFTVTNVATLGGFIRDGQEFAYGTPDGSVKLCEVSTGRTVQLLEKAGELVALLADGKTIATTSEDFVVKLWDITSGRARFVQPGKGGINSFGPEFGPGIIITSDGRKLAIINGLSKGITVWDVANRKILNSSLDQRESPLTFLQLSPDGKVLATGGVNGLVRFWDMATSDELLPPLQAHSDPVFSAAFSPDGLTLATASLDQTIKLWEFATRRELETRKGHENGILTVTFSPDGKRLASGGLDKTVRIWNLRRQPVQPAVSRLTWARPLMWSPDSQLLAGDCRDQTAKIWDAATLEIRGDLPNGSGVLTFSDDGKTVVTKSSDGTVKYCDLLGQVLRVGPKAPFGKWAALAISPDKRRAAIADKTPIVQLWDIASGKIDSLTGQTRAAAAVAFSSDGRTLISGGSDGLIDIWDVARQQCLVSIRAHATRIFSVAISPDGAMAASGTTDNAIKLWDLKTRTCLATLNGHKRLIWALAFSPDGKTLASGSGDHSVRLWNIPFRGEVAVLRSFSGNNPGVPDEIRSLNFSPNGNNLAAVTERGDLILFRAATGEERSRPN